MFKQIFSEKYRQDMQEKMAGMALRAMIEAINSKDFARIDDICSPHIAKMYKHALSHLDAQKCRLQVSAQTAGTPKIGGFMFKTGPPEAFDPSVPFATRFERYVFRFNNWRRFAAAKKLPSNKEGTLIPSILKEFSDTRLSVDVWCMVPVSVKIELWKNNGLLDSDQGNMTIPLTLSSPVYDDLLDITSAVAQFEDSDNLEPFRWSISDIFFIVDSREISQIYQCYMKAKDDLSSGNQE
ncbi:hypothetical protein LPJ64_003314 [Coemansia asiatica]|uniref:Uncharacterized protein n=1 Tax=Coemansia asiatica TaxID=1052880 RepID=A0A9W7XKD0_9FUNG|nr:hypothetical protein LPJ64_003314 [Coemansia asiatica]